MGESLYRVAELRALEQSAQAALAPGTLMQRAGAAAAVLVAARLPEGRGRVRIVCGPGNNGGDGYVCALELAPPRTRVRPLPAGPPPAGSR